jgi:hypothetical protein
MVSIAIGRGGSPPPPSLGGGALGFSCALAVYKPLSQQNRTASHTFRNRRLLAAAATSDGGVR